ncbi:aKG-HExxH-type peptide beta-hydroxylase [Actinophytocola sp.]|uniref:aKG-HExxH-type peptide beta-hydroxylase n=1 Tax=Actinophytocola sp. TaxID=1872138 RepID=UPI002D608CB3|nr:HEXXH motif-containing putative peptide modification protein [Actinophytocola sp.]HYQ62890.1 HEXXH motif-containing putative peptide modification protein [Actinophytocola sp.]
MQPEDAWRVLAEAEHRNPDAVADILMYPTVGVWLARALHHTRADQITPWQELGYLSLIAAAAAIRCGCHCTVRVPVWHGIVSLPTVGHLRVPGTFPAGSVNVSCAGPSSRLHVNHAVSVSLDGTDPAFTPARRHLNASRGMTLQVWIDGTDPYHDFGEPVGPVALTDDESAEWHKLVDEAWDVLTLNHPRYARELAAGLRMLVPIEPDVETVGASASAAFGGVGLSLNQSATEFAESLVHELQHSKLNALLALVKLTDGDDCARHFAPWRDDPRPLIGVVHGVYAFTCGIEFWLAQEPTAQEPEARHIAFEVAFRRAQVRRALDTLTASEQLTRPGTALVDAVSTRLAICEQSPVGATMTRTIAAILDDHQALWRLCHAHPDATTVNALAAAWLTDTAPPVWTNNSGILPGNERRLPANRRTLLRAKAAEPELFRSLISRPATLPGTTPRADAALCTGDYPGAAAAYEERLHREPGDAQAWVGLGLALRAQNRNATALLDHPEVTVAVHRRVHALCGEFPDPAALSAWLGSSR